MCIAVLSNSQSYFITVNWKETSHEEDRRNRFIGLFGFPRWSCLTKVRSKRPSWSCIHLLPYIIIDMEVVHWSCTSLLLMSTLIAENQKRSSHWILSAMHLTHITYHFILSRRQRPSLSIAPLLTSLNLFLLLMYKIVPKLPWQFPSSPLILADRFAPCNVMHGSHFQTSSGHRISMSLLSAIWLNKPYILSCM